MADANPLTTRSEHPAVVEAGLGAAGFDGARIIGRGGFGVVYRCRETALNRIVAVKVLTSSSDSGQENRQRFLREQRAMGSLPEHPNLVRILSIGEIGDHPFLVMPYYPRGSLEERIQRSGPLTVEEALSVGAKLSGALETVHRAGILHRDVKPGNVLLTDYDEPRLTDFGIARIEGSFRTSTGAVVGSPAFTAPEVLRGADPSVRSDVYGLGATLFCLITGHAACQRRSGEALVAQFLRITEGPAPDLRSEGIPDDLRELIELSMAADPGARPGSAGEFGACAQQMQRTRGLRVDDVVVPKMTERPPEVARTQPDQRMMPAHPVGNAKKPIPPVAETKFRPELAARPLIKRPRLLESINADPRPRLIVIHAPAGFGKSTLAAQWGRQAVKRGAAGCWLNIDDDDTNPAWFLLHLIEAIRRARPGLVDGMAELVEEAGADAMRHVLTTLINRVHSRAEHVVVVIEDWHRIVGTDSVEALRYLIDHACHHLQLLITSRESVRLPLSTLRVRGELVEIDSTALRFDRSETKAFLASACCSALAEGDVERLHAGTDGWVAGLQLASLSLRGREDPTSAIDDMSGRHHAISEYLTDNVLDRLSPDVLSHVLETSVAERICGDLASALTGTARGRAILEDIERHDLFLHRVDDDGTWFRYHHLFAEFLRQRLTRDRPEVVPVLHRRAAAWFTEHEMLGEAIDHALAGGEPEHAVRLLADRALALVEHSQLTTLTTLAAKLPDAQAAADPQLQIALAWAFALLRRADDMHAAVRSAVASDSGADPRDRLNTALAVQVSILRSVEHAHADRIADADAAVEQCVSHADAVPPFVLCAAANLGAFAALHRFEFDRAREWHRWGEEYFPRVTGALSVVYSHCFAGMAARELLDMAAAEAHFRAALHAARAASGESSFTVAVAAAMLGDLRYEQEKSPRPRNYWIPRRVSGSTEVRWISWKLCTEPPLGLSTSAVTSPPRNSGSQTDLHSRPRMDSPAWPHGWPSSVPDWDRARIRCISKTATPATMA